MRIRIPAILKKQTITQAALIIAIISFISKFFGFFREVLVAKYFGATGQTDAFIIALMIPGLILGLFSSGVNTLIIPIYIEKKSKSQQNAKHFVNSIFLVLGTLFIFLSILIFIFAPFFVKIIAYGFSGKTYSLAVTLTRCLIISGIFTIYTGMFTGLFQAEKQFFLPVFLSFLGNMALVFSLFLLNKHLGIYSWTLGQILYSAIPFLGLFFMLYWRLKFFHSLKYIKIDWAETQKFALLLLPLVMSSGLSVLNRVIDKAIASGLDTGSIAALNFATRIWQLPLTLLATPIATAIFPTFSELALNGVSRKQYEIRLNRTLSYMFYLTIPSSVFLFFLSKPAIRLLYERGAFDEKATALTSFVLKMYVLGLFAQAISPILAKAFFSFKNTKTPLIISSICIILNVILNVLLSRLLGAAGIALATSIVMTANIILYSHFLRKYLPTFSAKLRIDILKIILSSLPIGLICYISIPFLNNSSAASISGFISLAVKISAIGLFSMIPFITVSRLLRLEPYMFLKSYALNLIKKLIPK